MPFNMDAMTLTEMTDVFKKYMREVGGIPDINITQEVVTIKGNPCTQAIIKINDIPNLKTTGMEYATQIHMTGQEASAQPRIIVCDEKPYIFKSTHPGTCQQEMYSKLRTFLPFKPQTSLIDQLKLVNDNLHQLVNKLEHTRGTSGETSTAATLQSTSI
jgi:hypothetical protein